MLNPKQYLNKNIFSKKMTKKSIRDGFSEGLIEAGEKDARVVVLTADLKDSTRVKAFADNFPERFVEVGVAEQNLVTIASGMANFGKIPFATTYSVFSPGRTWEQIRTTICINDVPVKIIGCHSGFGAGPYGATHQGTEDIALMRVLPNMTVVVPCDFEEAKKATLAIAKNGRPSYLRLAREESAVITTRKTHFEIGKAEVVWGNKSKVISQKSKVAIVACGPLVYEALKAAISLEKEGIGIIVVNCHTIKPLDKKTIIEVAKKCGRVVTVEDHQIAGGLGSAVAELLVQDYPVPMEFVGIKDKFGESGTPEELKKKHGLNAEGIKNAVRKVLERKHIII